MSAIKVSIYRAEDAGISNQPGMWYVKLESGFGDAEVFGPMTYLEALAKRDGLSQS